MATMPVVAGVDGSEESLRAVEWAALAAQRHRAPLRIVAAPALPPRMRARNAVPPTGRADLVVIGRHSRGPAIGGIQHAVLSHAHGPIAIVPETGAVPDPMAAPDTAVTATSVVPDPAWHRAGRIRRGSHHGRRRVLPAPIAGT